MTSPQTLFRDNYRFRKVTSWIRRSWKRASEPSTDLIDHHPHIRIYPDYRPQMYLVIHQGNQPFSTQGILGINQIFTGLSVIGELKKI
jgi:hypothetical protein